MGVLLRYAIAGVALFSVWILLLPLGILRAFIIRDLWSWFFVPLGLPEISILHAFGIGLFATLFADPVLAIQMMRRDEGDALRLFLHGIAAWLGTWGLGAIVSAIM